MNNDSDVKPVYQKLDVGIAKPISINSNEAINIAKEQDKLGQIQAEKEKNDDDFMVEDTDTSSIKNNNKENNLEGFNNLINQEIDREQFFYVNDTIKEGKEHVDKKIYIFLFSLLALIFVVIVYEIIHFYILK